MLRAVLGLSRKTRARLLGNPSPRGVEGSSPQRDAPLLPPMSDRRGLKHGTILVREHAGVLHRGGHGERLRLGGKDLSESLGSSPGDHPPPTEKALLVHSYLYSQ